MKDSDRRRRDGLLNQMVSGPGGPVLVWVDADHRVHAGPISKLVQFLQAAALYGERIPAVVYAAARGTLDLECCTIESSSVPDSHGTVLVTITVVAAAVGALTGSYRVPGHVDQPGSCS